MEMIDVLMIGAFGLIAAFPIVYIVYKKGKNKLFYIASCFGIANLTLLFCTVATAPIAILLIKVIPQLAENGYIDNILFLLRGTDVISEYYFIFLYPVLSVIVPILVYRRYSVFHLTRPSI